MKKMHICGLVLLLLNVAQGFAQQTTDFEWESYDSDGPVVIITGYVGTSSDVIIPEAINGIPVTVIGWRSFEWKQLTSVSIPDSVVMINRDAFAGNQLTNINIPERVTEILACTFGDNRLTSITIPPSIRRIQSNAFIGNQITSITIGAGVSFMPEGYILESILGGSYEGSFDQAYIDGGRLAGIYTRSNAESTTWTRK